MDGCIFCDPNYQKKSVLGNKHFFTHFDEHPVTEGHMIIIPKRHVDSFFDLTENELTTLYNLLKKAKKC